MSTEPNGQTPEEAEASTRPNLTPDVKTLVWRFRSPASRGWSQWVNGEAPDDLGDWLSRHDIQEMGVEVVQPVAPPPEVPAIIRSDDGSLVIDTEKEQIIYSPHGAQRGKPAHPLASLHLDYRKAFAAQSRKLEAVLDIPGVRERLDELGHPEPVKSRLYTHKKTGNKYMRLFEAQMQARDWVVYDRDKPVGTADMQMVVVYQSMIDGRVWVRPAVEFYDRFTEDE